MKCNKCGYEWNTKSEKMFVTCPNCLIKVNRKLNEETLKQREEIREHANNLK